MNQLSQPRSKFTAALDSQAGGTPAKKQAAATHMTMRPTLQITMTNVESLKIIQWSKIGMTEALKVDTKSKKIIAGIQSGAVSQLSMLIMSFLAGLTLKMNAITLWIALMNVVLKLAITV